MGGLVELCGKSRDLTVASATRCVLPSDGHIQHADADGRKWTDECVFVAASGARAGVQCGKQSRFTVDGHRVCGRHIGAAVEQESRPWAKAVLVVPDFYDDPAYAVAPPPRRAPIPAAPVVELPSGWSPEQPGVRYTDGGYVYRQAPHPYCGSSSDRQSVGDPGHCEDCCAVGHLIAHKDYGCADVGCYLDHGNDCPQCTEPVAAHTDRGQCPPPL